MAVYQSSSHYKIACMNRTYKFSPKGQTIIEILVALAILVILLTVVTTAVVSSLSNAQISKRRNQASIFAQQGIEMTRQLRNSGWSTFNSFSGTYCFASTCTLVTQGGGSCGVKGGSCGQNVDVFSREVTFERLSNRCNAGGSNGTRVMVKVAWVDGSCLSNSDFCKNVTVESCFNNINANSGL